MDSLARKLVFAAFALAGAGCQNDFVPASAIQGLRVLAVRQDPASGSPGATVHLEMLLADPRPPGSPPIQIAWIGGCHNPPSRQYYACLPGLRRLAGGGAELGQGTASPSEVHVGAGPEALSFDEVLPDDILSAAPELSTDPVHYGVSYVFFAACAGDFALDESSDFPLTCTQQTDAGTEHVGPAGFVLGFATIYSYAGAVNQNPVLTSVNFDGLPVFLAGPDAPDGLKPCATDDDCADVTFSHSAVCSDNGACAPLLGACPAGGACPSLRVSPELASSSVESFSGGNEIIWASYYATHGAFADPTRLVVDRASGLVSDYAELWTPPVANGDGSRHTTRLWVTLNDERGGATWGFFDVVVE
jgi:hypothetical protein